MAISEKEQEMQIRSFASRDGSMEHPAFQLAKDRDQDRIRENRDALRFREPPYSEPSKNNGEAELRAINNALLDAIEEGKCQYTKAIYQGTFDDIEAHLENTGCDYGAWSYLEIWFENFAITQGLGNPDLEDLDAPGSDKLSLCFSWENA